MNMDYYSDCAEIGKLHFGLSLTRIHIDDVRKKQNGKTKLYKTNDIKIWKTNECIQERLRDSVKMTKIVYNNK